VKQSLEDYCRDVEEKAEKFAQEEEMRERHDHLQAFNLGRMVQRTENFRRGAWRRVGWLLAGLAIGLAFGRVYPDYVYPALAQRFLTKASLLVRGAGRAGLLKLWKMPRLRM
jgi:hypothetical protein